MKLWSENWNHPGRKGLTGLAIVTTGGILLWAAVMGGNLATTVRAADADKNATSSSETKWQDTPGDFRTDLFGDLDRLQSSIDGMFQRTFERFTNTPALTNFREHTFFQSMNVRDKKDHYEVDVNLPGQNTSDVKVEVKGNLLKVGAVDRRETSHKDSSSESHSKMISSFQQTITLPGPVKADQLKTQRQTDKLIITLPKA